jgi:hypothetical protein
MIEDFTYKVDKYGDNDVSIRYYLSGSPMSVGVIRATTVNDGLGRMVPIIKSFDAVRMVDYIMGRYKFSTEDPPDIMMEIRKHATIKMIDDNI